MPVGLQRPLELLLRSSRILSIQAQLWREQLGDGATSRVSAPKRDYHAISPIFDSENPVFGHC
jgi:hypothetical protein